MSKFWIGFVVGWIVCMVFLIFIDCLLENIKEISLKQGRKK